MVENLYPSFGVGNEWKWTILFIAKLSELFVFSTSNPRQTHTGPQELNNLNPTASLQNKFPQRDHWADVLQNQKIATRVYAWLLLPGQS